MVDRLAVLLDRFSVSAQVFNAGALCGINTLEADMGLGQLHLIRQGPLEVVYGATSLHIDEPSLLLFPRALTHRFISDPVRGADMTCATLRFEGGDQNPICAALPDAVCLPCRASMAPGTCWRCCSRRLSPSAADAPRW